MSVRNHRRAPCQRQVAFFKLKVYFTAIFQKINSWLVILGANWNGWVLPVVYCKPFCQFDQARVKFGTQ